MQPSDGQARYALRLDTVSWTPTDSGEVVVLDLRTSRYLTLNPAASVLWTSVVDGADVADLTKALVAEFAIDEARAARDVSAFLDDLRSRDLLLDVD